MNFDLDLMDMLRASGYGDTDGFQMAADIIGITPGELSAFTYASDKLSRLELIRVTWLHKFSEIVSCPVVDVIETYRDVRWGGWVYIIFWNDEYKIGKTISLRDRYQEFSYKYKGFIEVHTIRTNESLYLEKSLQKRYAEHNTHGEWYVIPDNEVQIIKSVKTVTFKPLLPHINTEVSS